MMLKTTCKICEKEGYISINDMSLLDTWLNKNVGDFTCPMGKHSFAHNLKNKDVFNVDTENPINEKRTVSEDVFMKNATAIYDEMYSEETINEHYDFVSEMNGVYLFARKNNEDALTTFQKIHSPNGKPYFVTFNI